MKLFVPSATFVVVTLGGGVAALPTTGDAALARRVGDFHYPTYWAQASASNGPIAVSEADGGFNYGRREEAEEDSDDVFYPFFNAIPQPSSGSMPPSGANSDTAAVQRREPEEESENFLPPGSLYWPPASMAMKPGITLTGGRGPINRRAEEFLGPLIR